MCAFDIFLWGELNKRIEKLRDTIEGASLGSAVGFGNKEFV